MDSYEVSEGCIKPGAEDEEEEEEEEESEEEEEEEEIATRGNGNKKGNNSSNSNSDSDSGFSNKEGNSSNRRKRAYSSSSSNSNSDSCCNCVCLHGEVVKSCSPTCSEAALPFCAFFAHFCAFFDLPSYSYFLLKGCASGIIAQFFLRICVFFPIFADFFGAGLHKKCPRCFCKKEDCGKEDCCKEVKDSYQKGGSGGVRVAITAALLEDIVLSPRVAGLPTQLHLLP